MTVGALPVSLASATVPGVWQGLKIHVLSDQLRGKKGGKQKGGRGRGRKGEGTGLDFK